MFKLGQTYLTTVGYEATVVSLDAGSKYNNKLCNICAIIKVPATITVAERVACFYTDNGKYLGQGNAAYDLISDEPTEEEANLIRQIGDIAEGSVRNREEALLKVIRQLRKK